MKPIIKGQDIGLLLKLVALQKQEATGITPPPGAYTARGLEHETGISKSQVSLSLTRCINIGLARKDRKSGLPRAHTQPLFEFIAYGLKYIFPAQPGELTRGMATAFAAPVMKDKLMSGGELEPVWPDARSSAKGLAVEPLFDSAPEAAKKDADLYALLALVDAIRMGRPRESNFAVELLKKRLELN